MYRQQIHGAPRPRSRPRHRREHYVRYGGREHSLDEIRATIAHLRACRAVRAAGMDVHLTTDPEWLVDMAIDRKAGWLEDPHARGAVMPSGSPALPRYAMGDAQRHLRQLAWRVNTPRLAIYLSELGEWRRYLVRKIPGRFTES